MLSQDTALGVLEQIHQGQMHMGEHLSLSFQRLPIGVFWQSKFPIIMQGCNQVDADLLSLTYPEQIINRSMFEICPKESDALAAIRDHENVIATGKPRFNDIRTYHHKNGNCSLLCITRIPMYDPDDNIVGVAGFFHDISFVRQLSQMTAQTMVNLPRTFPKTKYYYITVEKETVRLSARQAECLTYLATGKTVKEIANLLGCARSTVEDHLTSLKSKLGMSTTSALINCFWCNPIRWF